MPLQVLGQSFGMIGLCKKTTNVVGSIKEAFRAHRKNARGYHTRGSEWLAIYYKKDMYKEFCRLEIIQLYFIPVCRN